MSLEDAAKRYAKQKRDQLLNVFNLLKKDKETGKGQWQGYDANGNPLVRKNGENKIVKQQGNTGLTKGSSVYKDETKSADWQSRKKREEAQKTKIAPEPNKDKGNKFYRVEDQTLLLAEPGVGVMRYRAYGGYQFNERSLLGYVANGSTSGSISFYESPRKSLDNSRCCLALALYADAGFTGTSHFASITAPAASVSGDPSVDELVDSSLSFGPGNGSISLSAAGTFTAETFGAIRGQELITDGDLIEYISTPGGLIQLQFSSYVDFHLTRSYFVRSSLVDNTLFISYTLVGFDDTEVFGYFFGDTVALGAHQMVLLHVKINTETGSLQTKTVNVNQETSIWYLQPFNPSTDNERDFFAFYGYRVSGPSVPNSPIAGTVYYSIDLNYTGPITADSTNHFTDAKFLELLCQSAFTDDWIYLARNAASSLGTASFTDKSRFYETIGGTYNIASSVFAFNVRRGLPRASDYATYEEFLEDETTGARLHSCTINETSTLADLLQIRIDTLAEPRVALGTLATFEQYEDYVLTTTLYRGPFVEMELDQNPEGGPEGEGAWDNLQTFQVFFPINI